MIASVLFYSLKVLAVAKEVGCTMIVQLSKCRQLQTGKISL
jgi:hypothetical protein